MHEILSFIVFFFNHIYPFWSTNTSALVVFKYMIACTRDSFKFFLSLFSIQYQLP